MPTLQYVMMAAFLRRAWRFALHHTRHRLFREAAGCRKGSYRAGFSWFQHGKDVSAMVVQRIQKERNGSTLFSNPAVMYIWMTRCLSVRISLTLTAKPVRVLAREDLFVIKSLVLNDNTLAMDDRCSKHLVDLVGVVRTGDLDWGISDQTRPTRAKARAEHVVVRSISGFVGS